MSQENILTWNLPNWVSVVLMALVGFFILGSIISFAKNQGFGGGSQQSS